MNQNQDKKKKGLSFSLSSLFKSKDQDVVSSLNPYLATAKTWNSYHHEILAAKKIWQVFALGCLMCVLASLGGILYMAMQTERVPVFVHVDQFGQTVAVHPLEKVNQLDERMVNSQLALFIHDLRLVTPDAALQRKAIHYVYAMLQTDDPATVKINGWYAGDEQSSPFKRAERVVVNVEISSIIPQTPDTWQVDWIETVHERNGKIVEQIRMRALITVYILPVSKNLTMEQIRKNPTNLYISDLSWSRQTINQIERKQ